MTKENRGQKIFLSVVGVATLLVAVIGATFAWFSTTISGTGASGQVTTATISGVQLSGVNIAATPNVLPGWISADGSITVSVATLTGTSTIPYKCNVSSSNSNLPDLQYRIGADGAANSTAGTWTTITGAGNIVTGTLTASNLTDTYKVAVKFPETASNQNAQQNKTVVVTFTCSLTGGTLYYNTSNPGGTTVVPSTAY